MKYLHFSAVLLLKNHGDISWKY